MKVVKMFLIECKSEVWLIVNIFFALIIKTLWTVKSQLFGFSVEFCLCNTCFTYCHMYSLCTV